MFEIDVSKLSIDVQAGDVFGIFQPQEREARYSLAFLKGEDGPQTYLLNIQSNTSEVALSSDSGAMMEMQPLVTATVNIGKAMVKQYIMHESLILDLCVPME